MGNYKPVVQSVSLSSGLTGCSFFACDCAGISSLALFIGLVDQSKTCLDETPKWLRSASVHVSLIICLFAQQVTKLSISCLLSLRCHQLLFCLASNALRLRWVIVFSVRIVFILNRVNPVNHVEMWQWDGWICEVNIFNTTYWLNIFCVCIL